ncbi:DUF6525 family protein [Ruegeria marisrubri]|uniref:DUF6525 family protein n=1 Tax=Ruegeria marisrubri TaxID=1685379 RepID=UPI00399050E8
MQERRGANSPSFLLPSALLLCNVITYILRKATVLRQQQKQGQTRGRNLQSTLRRRRRQAPPMQVYDSLPSGLRQWLASASLPWSPVSAQKIWNRAGGARNPSAALMRLDAIEQAMLRRDAGVWTFKTGNAPGHRAAKP